MRRIGLVTSEADGERFCDYLVAQGIQALVRKDSEGVGIWVRRENDLEKAQAAFDSYQADPQNFRFGDAAKRAAKVRSEELKKDRDYQRRVHVGVPAARQPFTRMLVIVCCSLFFAQMFDDAPNNMRLWNILVFSVDPTGQASEIARGEYWRIFTPALVHFSVVHLLFNMLWLWDLGGQIERYTGLWRYILLIALLAAISSSTSYFYPPAIERPLSIGGGMSGVVYGLLGFILVCREMDPLANFRLSSQNVMIMGVWLVLGMLGVIDALLNIRIGNVAHVAGLLAGLAFGALPVLFRRRR